MQDAMMDMAEEMIDSGLLGQYLPMLSGFFGGMGGSMTGSSTGSMTGGSSSTGFSSGSMTGSMTGSMPYGGMGYGMEEQMDNYQDMMEDQMEAQREAAMYGAGSHAYSGSGATHGSHPMAGGAFLNSVRGQRPRYHLRRPTSRLLQKPQFAHRNNYMLRKPHTGMWPYLFGQANSAMSMFGYDGMDSEERMMALAMGANPSQLPPPTDGIDPEDMWMYGQSNPFYPAVHSATRAVTDAVNSASSSTSSSSGTSTAQNPFGHTTAQNPFSSFSQFMPYWAYLSSLQRPRPMKF